VPMGVANCSTGGGFVTGLACGDGGMERPRRGVRTPLWARPPGMGGRRRGAGDDMAGWHLAVGSKADGCIYRPKTRSSTPAVSGRPKAIFVGQGGICAAMCCGEAIGQGVAGQARAAGSSARDGRQKGRGDDGDDGGTRLHVGVLSPSRRDSDASAEEG
jgi:hypothetical protein